MLGLEFKYKIKEFYGPIDIKEFWDKCPIKIAGCYFLYDKNMELIYVGKSTKCIRQRINLHCYQEPSKYLFEYQINRIMKMREEVLYFSYTPVKSELCSFIEGSLINKFQPKYNKVGK